MEFKLNVLGNKGIVAEKRRMSRKSRKEHLSFSHWAIGLIRQTESPQEEGRVDSVKHKQT